jgi:hypothetical protein
MNQKTIEEQLFELKELVKPVMKWIAENKNPHAKIIIGNNFAELVEGKMSVSTDEFITD